MVLILPNTKPEETPHRNSTHGQKKTSEEAIPFSEALEKAKYGKFNYFVILTSGIIMTNVLLENCSAAFYMPVAHCDLKLTNFRKGLLSAIGYVGMIFSSHLWGFLADTKGRRRVIMPTLLMGFVATVFSSFATNFWIMLCLRFINGIFVSGASANIFVYLGEIHIDRTRSRAMMMSSCIFSLGGMAMPFLSYFVINLNWRLAIPFLDIIYKPWRLFVIVSGLPGLIGGLCMWFLPESPKFLISMEKEDETIQILQRIYKINGGKETLKISHIIPEGDVNEVSAIKNQDISLALKLLLTMWNQTVPLFRRKYLRSTLIICITQFWLYVITNGLYMWFPYIINAMGEFMKHNPGQNQPLCEILYNKHANQTEEIIMDCPDKLERTTFMYTLLMEILFVLSFALIGLIINRVGKITILSVFITFFNSCGLVAVWLPYTSISAIFYVLFFLLGVCINILGNATVDLYPTQLRAMAMCVSLMVGRIGSVVGTNIVGVFLASNCEMTFYIAIFAMMPCAILVLFLPRSIQESKNLRKSNIQET